MTEETGSRGKPVVLTFSANYLPGFKAGGILRSLVNTVDHLGKEIQFLIVTQDRDLKDCKPYADIITHQWQPVGGAVVRYLPPRSCTTRELAKIAAATPHDILYLNSFFDPVFTIKLLLARKLGLLPDKPVLLSPRGELSEASLLIKSLKKRVYLSTAKRMGLYEKITWHASSEYEAQDIKRVLNPDAGAIQIALDLPAKSVPRRNEEVSSLQAAGSRELRLVFLSRLSREKNLDYALKILTRVKSRVLFEIYGPAEDALYWEECRELIGRLPDNVRVKYLGGVSPEQVLQILGRYDLFFFPTTGENYGHVIAEALTTGTPVLISNQTPWRNLDSEGLGWDLPLADSDAFVTVIERLAAMSDEERRRQRASISAVIMEKLLDPSVLETNRRLFKRMLTDTN